MQGGALQTWGHSWCLSNSAAQGNFVKSSLLISHHSSVKALGQWPHRPKETACFMALNCFKFYSCLVAHGTEFIHFNLHVDMTNLKDKRQKRPAKYPHRRRLRDDRQAEGKTGPERDEAGRTRHMVRRAQCTRKLQGPTQEKERGTLHPQGSGRRCGLRAGAPACLQERTVTRNGH